MARLIKVHRYTYDRLHSFLHFILFSCVGRFYAEEQALIYAVLSLPPFLICTSDVLHPHFLPETSEAGQDFRYNLPLSVQSRGIGLSEV